MILLEGAQPQTGLDSAPFGGPTKHNGEGDKQQKNSKLMLKWTYYLEAICGTV
jgi:hypothetical protein